MRAALVVLIACVVAGCGRDRGPSAVVTTGPEPWAALPTARWPQLVLTNDAAFRGRTILRGASAFLARGPDGNIHVATARHLIGVNGGVVPEIPIAELDSVLTSWRVFPRTQADRNILGRAVASRRLMAADSDWLLLTTARDDLLPSYPLRLRERPVAVGERVRLVGCPYSEPACKQNVYQGVVTARVDSESIFRFDIDPPVIIPGFSGSPVLDQDGLVVGITSIWFQPRMQGDLWLESGAEDAAVAIPLFTD